MAARYARRRRNARRALLVAASVAILGAGTSPLLPRKEHPSVEPLVAIPAIQFPSAPAYEIISDEQLFATVTDLPLMWLADEAPGRRIVILSQ